MIISCPVCKTKYDIDAAIVPLSGKKLRCAKCNEVWKVYPKDWEDFEQKLKKQQDIENAYPTSDTGKKCQTRKKSCSFFVSLLKMLLVLIFLLSLVFAYFFRYQITENFSQAEIVYEKLGIESKVIGKGLVFEDVNWLEYEDNGIRKMDITGSIVNTTEKIIDIPLLHIELLNNEKKLLQNINGTVSAEHVAGGGRVPFKITILRPAPFTRYIFITFTKPN